MVDFVIGLECFGICLTMVALFLLLNGDGAKEQKLPHSVRFDGTECGLFIGADCADG